MGKGKLKVKGILFDLDGTLVDSREAYLEASRKAFHAIGENPPENRLALEIPKRLEQKLSIADIVDGGISAFLDVYLKTYYSVTREKAKPFPSVERTLAELSKSAKLALITMRFTSKVQLVAELERFGLARYFNYIVTAKDTQKPKPSPEALIQTVKALDVDICDCVIVGDSVVDIRAGKAAGSKTVAVLSGLYSRGELEKEQPDLILQDVTQLLLYVDSCV